MKNCICQLTIIKLIIINNKLRNIYDTNEIINNSDGHHCITIL